MNQPRSIYQSDFGPHAWIENNYSFDADEFCSSENVDDCLKYISQEFSALGYTSIYNVTTNCPYSVNCDIVKLLNAIFELLGDFKKQAATKEELESRNQRILTDFNVSSKKNGQLKERLEQTERKLNGSIEKERQLRVKIDNLQSLLKSEKDESKKLLTQIQQQKVAYQREIRRYENNLTQMKSKLNQILSDKNPEKKIANISTTQLLQRSTNQRGKWKTESLAKSSTDEMYSSLIMSYENRYQVAFNEIEEYKQCFLNFEQQLNKMICSFESNSCEEYSPCIRAILNGNNIYKQLMEKFNAMLTKVQDIIMNKESDNKNLSEEVKTLRIELMNCNSKRDDSNTNQAESSSNLSGEILEKDSNSLTTPFDKDKENSSKEKNTFNEQKAELAGILAQVKDEKAKVEVQKLEFIKNAVTQDSFNSPLCSKSVPSFCIVTTKNGITSVPAPRQIKECLSNPDGFAKSLSPLWQTDFLKLKTSTTLSPSTCGDSSSFFSFTSPESVGNDSICNELPKWARTTMNVSISEKETTTRNSISGEDVNIIDCKSEEDNLIKLKEAMADIENRRNNSFPQ